MLVRRLITACAIFAIALFGVFVVEQLWLQPVRVESVSMQPTLAAGDRVVVNVRTGASNIHRGDLIVIALKPGATSSDIFTGAPLTLQQRREVFARRRDPKAHYVVKRVIGLPGETVQATTGTVFINNIKELPERYLSDKGRGNADFQPVTLRLDEFWVMGDNRGNSIDSRKLGPVPRSAILGVVRARVWPLTQIERVGR